MRKPNLFIPGFPKSGTSSLHTSLCYHKEISAGIKKEPHTYSWDNRYLERNVYFKKEYSNLESKYTIDSSTTYLASKLAIERIVKDDSSAKFIIVARDPIDRIVSHFNWLSKLGLVELPFEDEILNQSKKIFNHKVHFKGNYKNYIEFSSYGDQLSFLLKFVERKNILFLEYEHLFENWDSNVQNICKFLDIPFISLPVIRTNITAEIVGQPRFLDSVKKGISVKRVLKWYFSKSELIIRNPINNKVNRNQVEGFLLPFLKQDIQLFSSLGFEVKSWKSLSSL